MKARIGKPRKAWVAVLVCFGTLSLGLTVFTSASSMASVRAVHSTAKAHKKAPLFLDVDTVSTAKANDCYTVNNFQAGSKVLFRIKVFNGANGNVLSSTTLKSVDVFLPGGVTLTAKYGSHKTDSFWTALWTIPATYAAGIVNYTVTARANNGAIGHYVPFDVTTASLTVVAAS